MKKLNLLLLISVFLVSCSMTYGVSHSMKTVKDNHLYWDGLPSYQVNTKDRYCLAYGGREHNFKGTKYDMAKTNRQIVSFLRGGGWC